MVIGQFNDTFPPINDGVALAVRNYAHWLNAKYGKCYVVTPNVPNHVDDEMFEVMRYFSVPMPRRAPYRLGVPQVDSKFARRLRKVGFDLVHAHSPFSSGQKALQVARAQKIPIVATFHTKLRDDFKLALKSDRLTDFVVDTVMSFYKKVDYVWTVNGSTVDTLREYGYTGDIEVMPNGNDFSTISDEERQEMCERADAHYGWAKGQTVLLFVGQQTLKKNTMLLLDALAVLRQRGVPFQLAMVGQGHERPLLEQHAKELGMEDIVHFLGNINSREQLSLLYARASLFLFPSVYDNAPLVVREAAAHACPPVLLAGTNAAEGVTHQHNGYLVDGPIAQQLAQTIQDALADGELLHAVGHNAQDTLHRSWEQIVDTVYERYSDIVSQHRTACEVLSGREYI